LLPSGDQTGEMIGSAEVSAVAAPCPSASAILQQELAA
jgi:hypothetical protein